MSEFIKWVLGTSVFGTLIGFMLGKFGTMIDEGQKQKKQGNQLIRNLYQEIGTNRYRCQALLKGDDPLFFETLSWDALRLNQAYTVLIKDRAIYEKMHFLYQTILQSNLRVGAALTALDSVIRNPTNPQAKQMYTDAHKLLTDQVQVRLLPMLNEMETGLRLFLEKEKIFKN